MDTTWIPAIGGIITAIGGIIIGYRGQNKTDKNNQLAHILEAYDEIVNNLRNEVSRLKTDVNDALLKLAKCESQCEECSDAVATLQSAMSLLTKKLEIYEGAIPENGN